MLLIKSGSGNNPTYETAHTLEHLLAHKRRFAPGAAPVSAWTNFDHTLYIYDLDSTAEKLIPVLTGMRDILAQKASFTDAEIEVEKKVVVEEGRRGKVENPVDRKLLAWRFGGGMEWFDDIRNEIKKIGPSHIRDFYADWYLPHTSSIYITGDIDQKTIEKTVKELFSGLDKGKISTPAKVAPSDNSRYFSGSFPSKYRSDANINILFENKFTPGKSEDGMQRNYLSQICRNILSDRLKDLNRGNTGLALSADFYQPTAAGFSGFEISSSTTDMAKIPVLLEVLALEIARIRKNGFTKMELELALKKGLEATPFEEMSDKVRLSMIHQNDQHGTAILDADVIKATKAKLLSNLQLSKLNDSVRKWLSPEIMRISVAAPELGAKYIPDEKTAFNYFTKAATLAIPQYLYKVEEKVKYNLVRSPVFPLKTAIALKTREIPEISTKEAVFENGLKVLVKDMEKVTGKVSVRIAVPSDHLTLKSVEEFYAAKISTKVVAGTRLGELSRKELDAYLKDTGMSFSLSLEKNSVGIWASAPREKLEELMQLVSRAFIPVNGEVPAYGETLRSLVATSKEKGSAPIGKFFDLLGFNYEVDSDISPQVIKDIDVKKSLAFYNRTMSDLSGSIAVVIGLQPGDEDGIKTVYEGLGNIPSSKLKSKADLAFKVVEGQQRIEAVNRSILGDRNDILVLHSMTGSFDDKEELALRTIVTTIQDRLTERLRNSEGGTYHVNVGLRVFQSNLKSNGKLAVIKTSFVCDPSRADALVAAIGEEIVKLQTKPPTQQQLDNARDFYRAYRSLAVFDETRWGDYLLVNGRDSDDLLDITTRDKSYDSLTLLEVQNMIAKFFKKPGSIYYKQLPYLGR